MVVEAARCGNLERSKSDCGLVGGANLPETLEDGLDVIVVVGNAGECGKSVSLMSDNCNGRAC